MKMKLFLHFQALLSFHLLLCLVSSAVLVAAADRALVSQFIGPQNKARAEVGVPPLVWDEKVARYAEAYAKQRKGDCALQHSNGPYGENIFWGSSGADWQPKDATSGWIGEKRFFNYATRTCDQFEKCGHYTQVVWKNSAKIGCAKVICDDGGTFITCNYDPPGNFIGEKPY